MLRVDFGKKALKECIYKTASYFDHTYKDEWITDELSVKMIKDIDKSDVISSYNIYSPVLGPITPRMLSGGVKTLLLIYFMDDKVFNSSQCGDNCAKWLLEIGRRKDVTIALGHLMEFGDTFEIYVVNTGKIIHNNHEYIEEVIYKELLR